MAVMARQENQAMDTQDIYEITPIGASELRSSATDLPPRQLALLVRFDGNLTLHQLQACLSSAARQSFDADFRALRVRGLLAPLKLDPYGIRFQAELGNLAAAVGQAEADAALHSLQRSGFFVQIARQHKDARLPAPGEPLSVLVVEDEPALARFIEAYLKLSGLQVRLAADRAEVTAALAEQPLPHLVLLDVMLPDADGFDILMRMRQHPVHKGLPVIMLTAKATRQAVIKGLVAGADGYLTKPFEPDSAMRAIHKVLGLPLPAEGAPNPWMNADANALRATGGQRARA
jgi:CheY-like chemotaxis protein